MIEPYGRYKNLERLSSRLGVYTYFVGPMLTLVGYLYPDKSGSTGCMIAGIVTFFWNIRYTSIWVDHDYIYFWEFFRFRKISLNSIEEISESAFFGSSSSTIYFKENEFSVGQITFQPIRNILESFTTNSSQVTVRLRRMANLPEKASTFGDGSQ